MLRRLLGRIGGGGRVPDLYPDLKPHELFEFMDEAEFERIKAFPLVTICPFVSSQSQRQDAMVGVGLSRLLIRDLMLLRDVSIRGPEDTPLIGLDALREMAPELEGQTFVGGEVFVESGRLSADISVFPPGEPPRELRAAGSSAAALAAECAEGVAGALGGEATQETRTGWEFGRPRDAESLARLGQLIAEFEGEGPGQERGAAALARDDPGFVIARHLAGDHARDLMLDGLERDPYDAQLCFLLFCNVWTSRAPIEPKAFQFVRRAVELAPGHGKAHMCMPHTAPKTPTMLRHSELGYRLLPGNTFAASNFVLNLQSHGAGPEVLLEVAEEAIASDPFAPTSYDQMIEVLTGAEAYEAALEVAVRLQGLYEPVLHPRTRYCIEQNPAAAKALRSGRYDPAAENRKRIEVLRRQARRSAAQSGS